MSVIISTGSPGGLLDHVIGDLIRVVQTDTKLRQVTRLTPAEGLVQHIRSWIMYDTYIIDVGSVSCVDEVTVFSKTKQRSILYYY